MHVRDVTDDDHDRLLVLNAESVAALSALDAARLDRLLTQSAFCRAIDVDGRLAAFVLAFREGADYDSENYRWFAARYPRFLYVDRIVVDAAHRRAGLAQRLYADVFARARGDGVPLVACEYDVEPPNPASAHFHARQGFREVGQQILGRGKRVSLQVADVAGAPD